MTLTERVSIDRRRTHHAGFDRHRAELVVPETLTRLLAEMPDRVP